MFELFLDDKNIGNNLSNNVNIISMGKKKYVRHHKNDQQKKMLRF